MPLRLFLFITTLICTVLIGRFIFRDFIGQALIAYGETAETRNTAVTFAPDNPEVLAARARYFLYRADPIQPDKALTDLLHAVAAASHDYRYYVELSKAYEMDGDLPRAEDTMQRAVSLAPRYFETHWALANLRLRAGRTEESLPEFRTALELSGGAYAPLPSAAFSAYGAVTQALGQDLAALQKITPADALSQSYLADYLVQSGDQAGLDAALDLWRRLPQEDLRAWHRLTFRLLARTQQVGRFADEQKLWRRLLEREAERNGMTESLNLITNAGFEWVPVSEIYQGYEGAQAGFDWVFTALHPQVRARRDESAAHGGTQSLHLTFNAVMRSEFQHVSQLVPVEPNRSYQLSYFVKTERMPAEPPFLEIQDAIQPGQFSLRSVIPAGDTDWRELTLRFTTLPTTRALRLVICAPAMTTFSSTSPGEVWLDDFSLRAE